MKFTELLKSRTVWGGLLMFGNNILRASGYEVLDDESIQVAVQLAVDGIGFATVIHGRVRAARKAKAELSQ